MEKNFMVHQLLEKGVFKKPTTRNKIGWKILNYSRVKYL